MNKASSLFIVGARLNSSRLPQKHLLDLAGKPMIARIFARLGACESPANAVLATTADAYNDPLATWADSHGISCARYGGDVNDVVARVDAIVQNYKPQFVVYICGDCPLLAPDYIDQAIAALRRHPQWEGVGCARDDLGRRAIHEGMSIYSLRGWNKIVAHSGTAACREHVGLGAPQNFVRGEIAQAPSYYRSQHRISVDTAADYRFMDALYQRWYRANSRDSIVDLRWVLDQLASDPSLTRYNAHVRQKNGLQRYGAVTLVCEASAAKGIGQLRRSVKMAERMQEEMGLGTRLFILGRETELPFTRYCHCRWFANEDDIIGALAAAADGSPLILDIFPERQGQPRAWQDMLESKRLQGTEIIGVDRCLKWRNVCDKVILPTYRDPGINDSRVVWGWPYVIAERAAWQPASSRPLLILTGGSDARGYGKWLPQCLDNILAAGTVVRWVQGPFAGAPLLPPLPRLDWQVIESPACMEDVMRTAHTALCVYGVSLFELLAIGVPTAVLPAPEAVTESGYRDFSALGLALCLVALPDDLAGFNRLLNCDATRATYRRAMAALPIGDGVTNIVAEIARTLSGDDAWQSERCGD